MNDARVRRSRESLRRAFVELLTEKSPVRITIRDITAAAGVGYTTYFRHYANKEALLEDVTVEEVTRLTDLVVPVYDTTDPRSACVALCTYVDEHRPLWTALLTGGAAGMVKEELLRQGRATSASRSGDRGLPLDLGVALATVVIVEVLSWWLRQSRPWPVDRVAGIINDVGIRPTMNAAPAS